jgi:aminoglycoside 6'-N-acetyltransferase
MVTMATSSTSTSSTSSTSSTPTSAPAAPPAPRIEGRRVVLERVAERHVAALRRIHAEPGVAAWWRLPSADWPLDNDEYEVGYAVVLRESGEVRGYVQYGEETDPDYRSGSIDVFLDPAVHGRGYGREVVAVMAAYLVDERGNHRVTIDPAADNAAAIAAYAAVGFRPVGVMRQYERGVDGTWHDGLLMDLLAGELVRAATRP